MIYTVFVDGHSGTTGLKLNERLLKHPYVEIIKIDENLRKDAKEKSKIINSADIVFLCLPDDAAKESVSLLENPDTRVIDASTAHRVEKGWAYGLPELSPGHRSAIAKSTRVTNPGCHATAFALGIYPLLSLGIIPVDYPVTCHSVTGYSGGGKQLIEKYKDPARSSSRQDVLAGSRHYGLNLCHKHLPEMTLRTGLSEKPLFIPIIGDFEQGMAVAIPIHNCIAGGKATAERVHNILSDYYKDEYFVKVMPLEQSTCMGEPYFNPMACNDTNRAEIFVYGNNEQLMVITRLDNLGKGASGAAVQNMNIMLGIDERIGLEVITQ